MKISFCLYGGNPKYLIGALRNAELAPLVYPGWQSVFYVAPDVSNEVIEKLRVTSEVIIVDDPIWVGYTKGMWRFFSIDDYVIYRDCDSRLNEREADAVREWINSGADIHIMHDHPNHTKSILAGMFGLRGGWINAEIRCRWWNNLHNWESYYGVDEQILIDLAPEMNLKKVCTHNPDNFKIQLPNKLFVGQRYSEQEIPFYE